MRISDKGIALIKRFEGFRSEPYLDVVGVPTIGYGTTKNVNMQMEPISKAYAEELMLDDLVEFQDAIERYVKVPLTQPQFDALCSFVYNVGIGAFRRSTLLKKLNKGQYDQVPYELSRWNKGGKPLKVIVGLTRRRAAEASLWLENEVMDSARGIQPKRDVPSIVNTENLTAVSTVISGIGMMNIEAHNPIAWALALIMVVTAGVFLYLFLRRRGA